MDRLDESFAGNRHSLGTYLGAAVFLAGLVLVGIGALSVLMDALAGVIPQESVVAPALVLAAGAVTMVLFLAILALHDRPTESRVITGLSGSAISLVFVAAAWLAMPGLLGTLGSFVAGIVYLGSTLVLTGIVFEAAIKTDVGTAARSVSYVSDSGIGGASPGVADGGSEDDLQFLLDEDDED